MSKSPFISVPQPIANMGSILATLQALIFDVNILIVNAQSNAQVPNLTGATSFPKSGTLDTQLSNINNDIAQIKTLLAKNGIS